MFQLTQSFNPGQITYWLRANKISYFCVHETLNKLIELNLNDFKIVQSTNIFF